MWSAYQTRVYLKGWKWTGNWPHVQEFRGCNEMQNMVDFAYIPFEWLGVMNLLASLRGRSQLSCQIEYIQCCPKLFLRSLKRSQMKLNNIIIERVEKSLFIISSHLTILKSITKERSVISVVNKSALDTPLISAIISWPGELQLSCDYWGHQNPSKGDYH